MDWDVPPHDMVISKGNMGNEVMCLLLQQHTSLTHTAAIVRKRQLNIDSDWPAGDIIHKWRIYSLVIIITLIRIQIWELLKVQVWFIMKSEGCLKDCQIIILSILVAKGSWVSDLFSCIGCFYWKIAVMFLTFLDAMWIVDFLCG